MAGWRATRASCSAATRSSPADQPAPPGVRRQGARARPGDRDAANFPEHGPRARRQGRRHPAGQRQGGQRRLSAARQAAVRARRRRTGGRRRHGAGAGHGLGRRAALLDALGLQVGDSLLLGDASLRIARDHRHRARPRRRLHELRAARDAQRQADLASDRPGAAGQPRDLPPRGGVADAAQRRAGARSSSTGPRREIKSDGPARHARRVARQPAGPRCARRSTGPRSSSTWSRCSRRCSPRWRSASPRATSPAATSTTARCCACSACRSATIALQYLHRVRAGRPGRQRAPASRSASRCTTSSSGCSAGLVEARAAAAERSWPALFGARRRLHAAVRLRPAAGAAARARAAAARDPARRRRAEAGVDRGARRRCARLRGAAARGGERPEARPDRGRRLRRRGRGVRAAVVARASACCAARCREARRAALAGAGDARRSRRARRSRCCRSRRSRSACCALVLLVLLRTDLIASWRQATPPDAPNRFVINVQPDAGRGVPRAAARTPACSRYDWFPMIRGRLVAINGKTGRRPTTTPTTARQRLVDREFNLSHSASCRRTTSSPPARWTSRRAGRPRASRRGLAETLGLKLGDTLRFDIGGTPRRRPHHQPAQGRLGARCGSTSSSCSRPRRWPTRRSATSPPTARPTSTGLRQRAAAATSRTSPTIDVSASIAQVQRVLDQVDARGRVPVRLHARRRPGGAVRGGQRDARGARARVRGDARARCQRHAARAGAARRAARRRRAGRRARVARGDRGRLGAGALRVRVQLERVAAGAAARRARPARCWRWPPAGGACARC